jgi:hypothetical protein
MGGKQWYWTKHHPNTIVYNQNIKHTKKQNISSQKSGWYQRSWMYVDVKFADKWNITIYRRLEWKRCKSMQSVSDSWGSL